jgi:hypothetical protein
MIDTTDRPSDTTLTVIPREAFEGTYGRGGAIRLAPCPEGRVPVAYCECVTHGEYGVEAVVGCPVCGGLGVRLSPRVVRHAVTVKRCKCCALRSTGQTGPEHVRYAAREDCADCGGSGVESATVRGVLAPVPPPTPRATFEVVLVAHLGVDGWAVEPPTDGGSR